MTMISQPARRLALLSAGLALAMPFAAMAQTAKSGGDSAKSNSASANASADASADAATDTAPVHRVRKVRLTPYIEASQVVQAELSPTHDVLTYTSLAAGVEAAVQGRNTAASLSLRYERRIGWSSKTANGDAISGVARVGITNPTKTLRFDAGALAERTRVEANGAALANPIGNQDGVTQVYALYAGPSLSTRVGNFTVLGGYHVGYTKVNQVKALTLAPGAPAIDVFDHSVMQSAQLHAGARPGDVLPVGIGLGVGYDREDISNLDQRVTDFHARADVTVPVSMDLALVGGVGYEKVQISGRDAIRNLAGVPQIGSDGRYLTDKSVARKLAFDTSGLIWDAGVMWRPSRRTALEAHYGRRYGSGSFYGSFAYAPNSRSSLNVSVYDTISGFGGQVSRALGDLPTTFEAVRNPLSGNLGGCVASLDKGSCLGGVLGSVRSATFRDRGIMASYGVNLGRIQAGIGAGYDRRKFIAVPGTVLAVANGVVDQSTWLSGYLNGRIDQRSTFSTNVYAQFFQSGFALAGDATALGASAAYYRLLTDHLTARAAIGLDGIDRKNAQPDLWSTSALVGLRYAF